MLRVTVLLMIMNSSIDQDVDSKGCRVEQRRSAGAEGAV